MTRLIAISLACLLLCGCDTRTIDSRLERNPPRPPADLAVSVTVAAGPDATLSPAKFVIEPGGQLRASTGLGATRDHFPTRTRMLSDAQVTQIYADIVRGGLDLPARGLDLPPDTRISREPGRSLVSISVTVDNTRRISVLDADEDENVRKLVARLRSLARLPG